MRPPNPIFLPAKPDGGTQLRGASIGPSDHASKCADAPLVAWLDNHRCNVRNGAQNPAVKPEYLRALWDRLLDESGLQRTNAASRPWAYYLKRRKWGTEITLIYDDGERKSLADKVRPRTFAIARETVGIIAAALRIELAELE